MNLYSQAGLVPKRGPLAAARVNASLGSVPPEGRNLALAPQDMALDAIKSPQGSANHTPNHIVS